MKVAIVGGGPAGLVLALLLRGRPELFEVEVFDQNPRDATYGFGVVLSERVLPQLGETDLGFLDELRRASFVTRHQVIKHDDETFFVEGTTYGAAIARLELLHILERQCERRGVELRYEARIEDPLAIDAELVVGADGVNSRVRSALAEPLGATSRTLTNRLAWYGTKQHFAYPLLAFKRTELGSFVAAAYAYTESTSTFVAECDAETWTRSGLATMNEDDRRRLAERIFSTELGGHPLLSNKSTWGPLQATRTRAWSVGRYVLLGDALQSAHPTIGSGTRLAIDDAIALGRALTTHRELDVALASFRTQREPSKRKLIEACDRSIDWYEGFGDKLATLAPVDFVFDFMTRTGRITEERLFQEFPRFMAQHGEAWRTFSRARRASVGA